MPPRARLRARRALRRVSLSLSLFRARGARALSSVARKRAGVAAALLLFAVVSWGSEMVVSDGPLVLKPLFRNMTIPMPENNFTLSMDIITKVENSLSLRVSWEGILSE